MGGWEGGGGGSSLLESLNISPCSTVAIVLTTTCDKQSYFEVYITGCSAYKADVRSPEQDRWYGRERGVCKNLAVAVFSVQFCHFDRVKVLVSSKRQGLWSS